jgi:hypothetical protein
MIFDELISLLGSAGVLLLVGAVLVVLAISRQRRADPRWRRVYTITQVLVVAVLVLGVAAVLFAMSSDDPRLRL